MSWNFANAGGWEISGLSISSSELTIAVWAKNQSGAGDEAGVLLYDSTDGVPRSLLSVQNDRFGCQGIWTHTSGDVAALQSNSSGGYQWHLVLISISATGPTATSRADGGTAATVTPTGAWPGASMNSLRWGVDLAGTGFFSDRMAHLAIWNKALSAAERDDLWNGGTGGIGKNPRDVASANLIHYSGDNTTTPIVGSGTWSAVGATPTWDAADNPAVDDPLPVGGVALDGSAQAASVAQATFTDVKNPAGSAAAQATGSGVLSVGNERAFQFPLYLEDGQTPAANFTGLNWRWWSTLAAFLAGDPPDASGTGAVLDAAGMFSVAAPPDATQGEDLGFGYIGNQDATADENERAYVGSFDVI